MFDVSRYQHSNVAAAEKHVAVSVLTHCIGTLVPAGNDLVRSMREGDEAERLSACEFIIVVRAVH